MPTLETPAAFIGDKAAAFKLKGTDGEFHSLDELKGSKGTVIAFICNHCPYVKAQVDRLIRLSNDLKAIGVNFIAINSNDTESYSEDSFENMQALAQEKKFNFPYLIDETQAVAKAYGAICTPDIYGYDASLKLQYRGRLDESWSGVIPSPKRELYLAMKDIAETGKTSIKQLPSIGCSIKWKLEAKKIAAGAA